MTIICSSYKLTLTKLINIITNSFLTFSLVEKSTLVRLHLVSDPKRQTIAFLLLPKISHNFDILKTGSKGTKSFMFTGGWVGWGRSWKQAKYSQALWWCMRLIIAWPGLQCLPGWKVTWNLFTGPRCQVFTGPRCETSRPRHRQGGVRLHLLPHNQPRVF